jgi:uncharacterized membrane protein YjfL (UPF0719 family)
LTSSGPWAGLSLLVLCFVLLLVAKMVKDLLTPYRVDEELTKKRNVSAAASMAGYLLGTAAVLIGAASGPTHGMGADLLSVGGYGLLGIALLNVSRYINDFALLPTFENTREIVEDQNLGTGAVEFGSYLASGLVIAGSIQGEGGGILTALAFFALGQLALILFAKVYDRMTPYDIHEHIEQDNVAVGLAFGGTLVALGVILMNGVAGDFVSWSYNLAVFGVYSAVGIVVLPLVRIAFDKCVLPSVSIDDELSTHSNAAVGLLEMVVVVTFAVLFYFCVDLTPLIDAWGFA